MSSPLSANLEAILDRFDDAWNGPTPPRIEDYLMKAGPDQQLTLLIELVRIDLERRLVAGEKVRLEEAYLPRFPELFTDSPAIVTLAKHEYAVRRRNEPELTPAEYLARFPQCQTELVAQLPTLDDYRDGQGQQKMADASAGLDLRGYELIETLGKGGMGEVYRCIDPALGRDLAIKVMMTAHRGHPQAERRFLREARVTGSLQHPSIVPIHNLGRLNDGRLHYTMRLVRGRTFADILKEEAGKSEHLPYLLSIFEKICQAVAYAHSKRVIHRDLKPHNVMVGKFGEVQVMDWGLAKVLTPADCPTESEETMDAAGTRIVTETADTPTDLSRAGSGMGTPAYMPTEQALGEWDIVDERADVFALGSILCEIVTGQPAYSGTDGNDVYRRAKRGDMAEALQRLQQCGADVALTALCRECLNLQREERPRDAAAVAKRVAEYQAEVQERLRQAELERVAAETRAREEQARVAAERRASRRLLGLAAAIVVFVLVGGVGLAVGLLAVRGEQRRTQDALDQVTAEQAKTQAAWKQTREALNTLTDDVIEELLGKQPVLGEKEKAFLRKALGFYEQFAAERGEGEGSRVVAAEGQFRVAKLRAFLGENTEAESGYRVAVRLYDKLADDFPAVPAYRQELANSHHGLGLVLDSLGKGAEAETAYRQAIALQEKLTGEFPALPQYIQNLARSHNNLGRLLGRQGNYAEAEPSFRRALALQAKLAGKFPAEPKYRQNQATSHHNLGVLLGSLGKRVEAVSAEREAIALQEKLVADYPAVPPYQQDLARSYNGLGAQLARQGKRLDAESAYRKALSLREKLSGDFPAVPEYRMELATSHNNLGVLLENLGNYVKAESAHRQAIALQEKLAGDYPAVPKYRQDLASSYDNLGILLNGLTRSAEAEAAHRQAIVLKEKLTGDYPAVTQYRQALAGSYVNFGNWFLARGRPEAALDWCSKAIPLLETILAQEARLATARLFLRNAYVSRAKALVQLGRHADAARVWLRAAELDDGRMRVDLRLQHSLALVHAGEHQTAVKTTEELLASSTSQGKSSPSGLLLYNAACVYALSSAAVKDDATLREHYSVRAVALLRQAEVAGFFKDSKQIEEAKKDTDLDALRQREDFKRFLAELDAARKKPNS